MELRQLRYFCVLAKTLNFTRAAELLHIAQPPLSRQIQQMEDELGVVLIERGRPLKLTEAGRFFNEQAAQLLEQFERSCADTRRMSEASKRFLSIGFAPSTLYGQLPDLIRRLRSHGDIELNLAELITLQQVEALKRGRIDIGFGRILIEDAAIVQVVLREDPLVAVLPEGHPLLATPVSLAQLAQEPFILYPGSPRPSYADHILKLFANQGLTIHVAQTPNELQTAIGLVAAGVGVTLVPASVQRLHRDDIGYTPLLDSRATSPIVVSYRAGDRSAMLLEVLAELEELAPKVV
ncbi:transcriptional regulator [Pseudomonas oryzihabitans]|uniref:LysR family transcriptional regulator n=1 Tax=Pseudomonas rhizoryzae TaxID=2571129 RepID=UPI000736A899|nr:LysR family transcriptional regulator [Pseudomonas rhizoryzae]APQ10406.1 LysR family transcriptional regulator [Pseudomonas psychrotolerans]KTS79285.1 transcriptional regulator [Pseudomonas psychrotolerans]KTT07336.1 transcriptional regulator [Pseudomonas psychrotolerans]KTT30990.1 transcriptional regulator [Pseudomonas psychrotolerans]KTT34023.1 transcriptional regulator [Pseudomonas psychrotolerans]